MSTLQNILAFEAYALSLLKEEALSHGQRLLIGPEIGPDAGFDALAPEGFQDLAGTTVIELKRRLAPESVFRFVDLIVRRASETRIRSILFLVEDHALELDLIYGRLRERYPGLEVVVWGAAELERLAEKHPNVAVSFAPNYLSKAIQALVETVPGRTPSHSTSHVEALRRALGEDNLVLFLGAGCSIEAGLPTWNEMLSRLAMDLIKTHVPAGKDRDINEKQLLEFFRQESSPSPLIVARMFRDTFDADFAERVQSTLYAGASRTPKSRLLRELARLCVPRRNGVGVVAVVTYNFDDVFEEELNHSGVRHRVILSEDDASLSQELPVFHVHGFLPRRGRLTELHRASLVLSEEAYHQQFIDPYAWSTITQLNLLRDRVCLFVGHSMTDPNLRRLLEISQRKRPGLRHYVVLRDHWTHAASETSGKDIAKYAGIFRGLEEASLRKLGVQTIWIDDFDRLPALVKSIREPGPGAYSSQGEVAAGRQQ